LDMKLNVTNPHAKGEKQAKLTGKDPNAKKFRHGEMKTAEGTRCRQKRRKEKAERGGT